jgi:hypothetical protein
MLVASDAPLLLAQQQKFNGPSRPNPSQANKKAGLITQTGLFNLIPAATYVPTQLPVQYHRPGEA